MGPYRCLQVTNFVCRANAGSASFGVEHCPDLPDLPGLRDMPDKTFAC